MKKLVTFITSLLVLLFTAFFLTGCVSRPSKGDVSIVLSPRQYFPQTNVSAIIEDHIYEAVYDYKSVSAIVDDGKPYVGADFSITKPSTRISKSKHKDMAEKYSAQIQSELSKLKAKTGESDWLTAVTISANVLHSKSDEEFKTMIIFDNFLSTTGIINNVQNPGLMSVDANEVVDQLKRQNALPDLRGIDVIIYGLGQTCGSQPEMDTQSKDNLNTVIKAVMTAAGANSVSIKTDELGAQEYDVDVSSSIIPFATDCLKIGNRLPDITILSESSGVKFIENSCSFVNEKEAAEALSSAASLLKDNSDLKVIIVGMTELEDDQDLSIRRAETCKSLLVEDLGVNNVQITCVGLGNKENTLRSAVGFENRAVYMVNAESEIAKSMGLI